jgi:energy-coupling factor transporter ATP-binding protein EcfA2
MTEIDDGLDASEHLKKVLLDNPTTTPALGFDSIGRAFATIISESPPQFAIGIFGGWGSGKTTLMKVIKSALPSDTVICVDFNAWRFEREPQLLIPLLDTIRAALVRWAEPKSQRRREKVRAIATRVGRVVRALATGLSAEVGLPGAAKVSYDVGTALDALSPPGEPETPQSLYVAAFLELERAFSELSATGAARVVVFVDDLDRCLPSSALDVLESMKLFFDLPGFVFVVGLDEEVVERAIRAKFSNLDDPAGTSELSISDPADAPVSQRLGREYVKKIFQLPYSLPTMVPQQLDELLESMYKEVGGGQLHDLRRRVRPYLQYVAVEGRVNPREVKRFINAYTLQTLIRPELDASAILALQTIAFRSDWELLYDGILADSTLFVDALRRYRRGTTRGESTFEDVSPSLESLPPDLASYLRSPLAEPLTQHPSLDTYLSSLQSTGRHVRPGELEAYRQIGQLRREIRDTLSQEIIPQPTLKTIAASAREVVDMAAGLKTRSSSSSRSALQRYLERVARLSDEISLSDEQPAQLSRDQLTQLQRIVEKVRTELQIIRNDSVLNP